MRENERRRFLHEKANEKNIDHDFFDNIDAYNCCCLREFLHALTGYGRMYDGLNYCFDYKDRDHFFNTKYSISLKKNAPARESTVSAAEYGMRLGQKGEVFVSTAAYSYDFKRRSPEQVQSDVRTLVIDVDDIPELNDTENGIEVLYKLYEKFPFIRYILPNYVITTGNKGIHIIYVVDRNLLHCRADAEKLLKILTVLFHGDMAHAYLGAATRLPFCTNEKTGKMVRLYNILEIASSSDEYFNKYHTGMYGLKELSHNIWKAVSTLGVVVQDNEYYIERRQDIEENYLDYDENNNPVWSSDEDDLFNIQFYKMEDYLARMGIRPELKNKNFSNSIPTRNLVATDADECAQKKREVKKERKERDNAPKKKKAIPKNIFEIQHGTSGREMRDLRRFYDVCNGELTGTRNMFLYGVGLVCIQEKMGQEDVERELRKINGSFSEPLPEYELKPIIKAVEKARGRFRFNAEKAATYLSKVPGFLDTTEVAYTYEQKKAQKLEWKQKDRKKKSQKKKQEKFQWILEAFRLYKLGFSFRKIADVLGKSKNTVKKYIREILSVLGKDKENVIVINVKWDRSYIPKLKKIDKEAYRQNSEVMLC